MTSHTLTSFSARLTIFSLFFILFGSKQTLYALAHERIGAEDRYIARQIASENKRVRIEGEIACTAIESIENTAQNSDCTLNITESRTGKTYRLSGDNASAKKLFENGKKNVAVEGTFSNGTTLNVQVTQAL